MTTPGLMHDYRAFDDYSREDLMRINTMLTLIHN